MAKVRAVVFSCLSCIPFVNTVLSPRLLCFVTDVNVLCLKLHP